MICKKNDGLVLFLRFCVSFLCFGHLLGGDWVIFGQRIFSVGAAWITKRTTNQIYPLARDKKIAEQDAQLEQ